MADNMPLLQAALVNRLIKQVAPDCTISSEYRQEVQKAMTIYLHYAQTMAVQLAGKRKAKNPTVVDLKEALVQVGLGEVVEDIEKTQITFQENKPEDLTRLPIDETPEERAGMDREAVSTGSLDELQQEVGMI